MFFLKIGNAFAQDKLVHAVSSIELEALQDDLMTTSEKLELHRARQIVNSIDSIYLAYSHGNPASLCTGHSSLRSWWMDVVHIA